MVRQETLKFYNQFPESPQEDKEPISKRDYVISSFNRALILMQADQHSLSPLSPEEELNLILLKSTAEKIRFRHGDDTTTRQWHDKKNDEQYTIEEGVPIEALLSWLESKMTVNNFHISQDELPHILEAKELFETLSDFSIPFQDCHDEMPQKTYRAMRVARIRLEEELIRSHFPNLNSQTLHQIAHKRINGRLELRPPKDYASTDRIRDAATVLFTGDLGNDKKDESNIKRIKKLLSSIPKESAVFVATATAANTILQDQGFDPEAILATSTATVTGVSALTEYKRQKNNNGNSINKKQIAKYSVASGGATFTAGTMSPEAILYLLDAMPEQIQQVVKAGVPLGTAFAAGAFKNSVKTYFGELFEKSKTHPSPKMLKQESDTDPFKQSQITTYESVSYLMNHYAKMSNLAKRLGGKFSKQWNIQGSNFEETTKQLMMTAIAQKGSEPERAFVKYQALSNFIRFRELFIDENVKKPNEKRRTPAFDALRELDHIALSVFDNLPILFEKNPDELQAFSFHYERGLGLAYLLSLQKSWSVDDPRKSIIDEQIIQVEQNVYGESKENLEKKVDNAYQRMLKIARFKNIRNIKTPSFTGTGDVFTDVLKEYSKKYTKR